MKLSGRNQVIMDRSLIDIMKFFKEVGYDGLELSILCGMTDRVAWDYLDDYNICHINDVADQLDLPITALSCHQNYVLDNLIYEAQKMLLKKARSYRTNVVIMSTPIDLKYRESNEKDIYRALELRTKELCHIAEEHGVQIAIEVEPNQLFRNLSIFLDMADRINSPALKLNFDVGHLYLSEPDLYEAVEAAAGFIAYSHIDNMCRGEHCHKLPWDGEIDLVAVYQEMKDRGYEGTASLDIYLQDYMNVSAKCVNYIKKEIFAKLK